MAMQFPWCDLETLSWRLRDAAGVVLGYEEVRPVGALPLFGVQAERDDICQLREQMQV